jgi:hypothetical protein
MPFSTLNEVPVCYALAVRRCRAFPGGWLGNSPGLGSRDPRRTDSDRRRVWFRMRRGVRDRSAVPERAPRGDVLPLVLVLVGHATCLVTIVIVTMLGSPGVAVSVGATWATTCGVLAIFFRADVTGLRRGSRGTRPLPRGGRRDDARSDARQDRSSQHRPSQARRTRVFSADGGGDDTEVFCQCSTDVSRWSGLQAKEVVRSRPPQRLGRASLRLATTEGGLRIKFVRVSSVVAGLFACQYYGVLPGLDDWSWTINIHMVI